MKILRIITIVLLTAVATNALVAGYLFMSDPTGSALGLSTDLLQYSPFETYFVPGFILFTLNGLLNALAAVFVVLQLKGWKYLVFVQGTILFGWIAVQAGMIHQLHFLHVIMAAVAIILILVSITPEKKTADE